jgi:hypothetical protein
MGTISDLVGHHDPMLSVAAIRIIHRLIKRR